MTNAQLADLLEEAARRLRGEEAREPEVSAHGNSLTTAELSAATGVPPCTIRKFAKGMGGLFVGGRRGYVFPKKAIKQLPLLIQDRASKRKLTRTPGVPVRATPPNGI